MDKKTVKKKIMIVGASGYGNVGDDAYKMIFDEQLSNEYELYFDSPYPDLRYMAEMDALVIGGGGLIYDNQTDHFYYTSMYLDKAIELNIPFCFISCGLQFPMRIYKAMPDDKKIEGCADILKRWKPYIEKARLITVRSEMDKAILQALAPDQKIHVIPDLCYLIKPCDYHLTPKIKLLLIPIENSFWDIDFIDTIRNNPGDGTFMLAMSKDDYVVIDFAKHGLTDHGNLQDRMRLCPKEAARVIADSEKIVSCRFHGVVFARAVGKKEEDITILKRTYKTKNDVKPENIGDAIKHIELLKIEMERIN